MPYKVGASNLPPNVKKMSPKAQARWVAIFNNAIKDGKDEKYAFAAANGVVGGSKKDMVDEYDTMLRQLSQTDAQYSAVGMKDGMACASCHWFVSPDSCVLVRGAIAPTGLSKFYMQATAENDQPDAAPVYMVDTPDDNDEDDTTFTMPMMGKSGEGNIVKAVINGVKSLLSPSIIVKGTDDDWFGGTSLRFFKGVVDGTERLRFLLTVSNNFSDREGEIFPEEVHKEYVDWATESGIYPQLWLWHSGEKSRWGQGDFVALCDGFVVGSGLVDSGKEQIAYNLAAQGDDVRVSHGFFAQKSADRKTFMKYRDFEWSPLPAVAAANEWTGFNLLGETMPFTQEKKDWLRKAGVPDATITVMETGIADFAKALKDRGVDWKDYVPDGGTQVAGNSVANSAALIASSLEPWDSWGEKAVTNAHKTKPAEYADVATDDFLDPANFKYPADAKHIKAALDYFNHGGQKDKGGYSDAQWSAMGHKLASKLGAGYTYKDGQVVHEGEAAKGYNTLAAAIATLAASQAETQAQIKALTETFTKSAAGLARSEDATTADFFRSRVAALPQGMVASEAADNIVGKKESADAQDWFGKIALAGIQVGTA